MRHGIPSGHQGLIRACDIRVGFSVRLTFAGKVLIIAESLSGTGLRRGNSCCYIEYCAPARGRAPGVEADDMTALALFLMSFAALFLEMVQCRICSYSIAPVLVYGVITVALLGFGTGSVAVTLLHQTNYGRVRLVPFACAVGFALSVIAANIALARFSHTISISAQLLTSFRTMPLLLVLATPYIFAGAFIAAVFAAKPENAGRTYFFNLIGSAVGCFALFVVLKPLGAERCVSLIAVLGAISAFLVAERSLSSNRQRALAIIIAVLLAALLPVSGRLYRFQPDPRDNVTVMEAVYSKKLISGRPAQRRAVREYGVWNPIGRVEVYSFPGIYASVPDEVPMRYLAIDSGNGSVLIDFARDANGGRDFFEGTVYGTAYFQGGDPSVMIVGLGGTPDISAALHAGARSVTAVEINSSVIDVGLHDFADFLGRPYEQPGVTVVNADARSFIKRTKNRYDVIQMNVTDSMTASMSGSLVFSESYLYTVEAFYDFLEKLSPEGVFSVVRFVPESVRTVTTAVAAMRKLGIKAPASHVAIVQQGVWINVLMKRQPFSEQDIALLRARVSTMSEKCRAIRVPTHDRLGFALSSVPEFVYWPGCSVANRFSEYFDEEAAGRGREHLLSTYNVNVEPSRDDKPFFFFMFGLRDMIFGPGEKARLLFERAPSVRGAQAYLLVCAGSIVWAAVLIVLPTILQRKGRDKGDSVALTLLYFLSLGLGYMVVEIGLMQKTTIFLGHPAYSVSFTLCALLTGSGLGGLLFSHVKMPSVPRILLCSGVVAGCVALCVPLLGPVFSRSISLPLAARGAMVIVGVGLLGIPMGVPFPSGLRLFCGQRKSAIAWAIGANGFSSVLGSAVAIPIAISSGFKSVLLTGSAAYVCAFACALLLYRRTALGKPPRISRDGTE